MPELPEVETIRRNISKKVCGEVIEDVNVLNIGAIENKDRNSFIQNVKGATINSIDRRGKYLIFNLNCGTMVLHLRLNGQLYVTDYNEAVSKYACITFYLSNSKVMHFDDMRKFAKASFIPVGENDIVSGVHRLGIEPFDAINLSVDYLKRYWSHQTFTVKEALLNQDVIAGFGNFYSDEILFLCGINPNKRCINLTDKNYQDLVKCIPEIMEWGIRINAISEKDCGRVDRDGFNTRKESYVYGRAGQPCKVCGCRIVSTKLGGRTCCYCPACQMRVKIIRSDVDPDMLADVAKFIGTCIKQCGSFDVSIIYSEENPNISAIRWEDFVRSAYKYIMSEQAISIVDDPSGDSRVQHSIIVKNISDDNFDVGINWIRSQAWKEW